MNNSPLPPSLRVLCRKVLPTNYIAGAWLSARQQHLPTYSIEVSGLAKEACKFKWFNEEVAPKIVDSICTEDNYEEQTGTRSR